MSTVQLDFTHYYTHAQLTEALQQLATAYPNLATLTSVGKSHQGREVWLLTITNQATGRDLDKPAFYLDGHIHAEEVATSQVVLYTAWYLLTRYGEDPMVTHLVDTRAFYIFPRFNPDGGEISLTTGHHWCGNGRYLPGDEFAEGFYQMDLNDDNLIVQMRVPDPNGEWKISDKDPRLMRLREPGEVIGTFYRLYPEGLVKDWDGGEIKIEKPRDGNMNRNFPSGWRPEHRQYGAGLYPLSEPESKGIAEFILSHPNIACLQAYHTHSGVILRPSLVKPDSEIPPDDLAMFKIIGKAGTDLTSYPVISVYEEFTDNKSAPRVGSLLEWVYEEMGIVGLSTELWDVETAAGIHKPQFYPLRSRSEEEELKLLAWNDTALGGKGFVNWHAFEHPQLGPVEIGGWTHMYVFRNPPPADMTITPEAARLLPDMCHANCLFNLHHAATTPLIAISNATADHLGADLYRVRARITNNGFLPTFLTARALENNVAQPVKAEIQLGEGMSLEMGKRATSLGHLAGRSERRTTWSPWMRQWSATSAEAEWLVRAPQGGTVTVRASSEKGGTVTLTVHLGGA